MEDINKIFQAALKETVDRELTERGERAAFARKVDIPQSRLNDILSGHTGTVEEKRRSLAAALGYHGHLYDYFLDRGRAIVAGRPIPEPPADYASEAETAAGGYFPVPLDRADRLGAGGIHAQGVAKPETATTILVHGPTLGRRNSRNLKAFVVGGDSMEPLIADGGLVVADLTKNRTENLKEGAAYVIRYDEEGDGAVKYLRWAEKGKSLILESENKFYKPVVRKLREVALVGQVIWSCREHK